jgi:hypothetical protein
MTLPQDTREKAISYTRHQATKSLAELSALMERTGAECAGALEGMSDAQASFKPGEEWSVKEVIDHMIVTSRHINDDIERMAAGRSGPTAARMGQTSGGAESIEDMRQRLAGLWMQTARLVAALPEDGSVDITQAHPWFGDMNFREWIAFQRLHAMDHIGQIEKLKADANYPKG